VSARLSVVQVCARAATLADTGRRVLLGVTGPPGSGKSTLAHQLADGLGPDRAAVVPMDGFHLANRELDRLGRRDRKGAIDTFDGDGYLSLVRRLAPGDADVYCPDFDRSIDEPIAAAILVPASVPLVICEGNYLLHTAPPWSDLAELLTETWYCDPDDGVRLARLIARHEHFGKSPAAAQAWATGPDERNAELIRAARDRADVLVDV
jgi:pantothenate kinase